MTAQSPAWPPHQTCRPCATARVASCTRRVRLNGRERPWVADAAVGSRAPHFGQGGSTVTGRQHPTCCCRPPPPSHQLLRPPPPARRIARTASRPRPARACWMCRWPRGVHRGAWLRGPAARLKGAQGRFRQRRLFDSGGEGERQAHESPPSTRRRVPTAGQQAASATRLPSNVPGRRRALAESVGAVNRGQE